MPKELIKERDNKYKRKSFYVCREEDGCREKFVKPSELFYHFEKVHMRVAFYYVENCKKPSFENLTRLTTHLGTHSIKDAAAKAKEKMDKHGLKKYIGEYFNLENHTLKL